MSWLADHVDAGLAPDALARRLSGSGTLVEAIHAIGVPAADGNLAAFRVGRVLSAERHPNADRLRVCTVDLGDPEPATIVCGAPNVAAGQTVAVALPGALLPGAEKPLGVAKLRGVESRGMILSATELALGTDSSGIMELDEGPAPGTPLAEVLPISRDGARAGGHLQPAGLPVGAGRGPRGARRHRRRAGAARRVRPARRGRGPCRGPGDAGDPGPRPLPALHGPRAHRRRRRAVAGLDAQPPRGRGDALDLERRGRDQLRHAPHRSAAARVRPRPPGGRADRGAPRHRGRADRDARRRRAAPRPLDARDLRRRAAGRDRRHLRRGVRRGLGGHAAGAAGGGDLRRPDDPQHLPRPRAPQRVERALREGPAPRAAAAGDGDRVPHADRALRRPPGAGHPRRAPARPPAVAGADAP